MTPQRNIEIGSGNLESDNVVDLRIESLDDIVRAIAARRLTAEFSDSIAPEKMGVLRGNPDHIEKPDEFWQEAANSGIEDVAGVIGWSTDLESPAHIKKNEVAKEIATEIHEDLHRLTAPETLREMSTSPVLRELYEGVTEFLTEEAAKGLHEHKSGECYPEQVVTAERLAKEVGESALRKFFFRHEMTVEVSRAIERLHRKAP
jgi:hypothetical protein